MSAAVPSPALETAVQAAVQARATEILTSLE